MASKINDRDLRRQALFLTDPYDQPDLRWESDPAIPVVDILNVYKDEQWPARKVFCVSCRGHHHQRGFTCIRTDGSRVLVGSACGERVLGQTWRDAEKRMNSRVQRKHELDRYDRLAPIITPMRQALRGWEHPIGVLAMLVVGFRSQLGELWSRADEAARRRDGRLMVARRAKSKPGREPEFVEVEWGRLKGAPLFAGFGSSFNVVSAVEEATKALDDAEKVLPNTEVISTPLMTRRRKRLDRAFEGLERAFWVYEGGQEFFSELAFRQLVEWSWALGTHERYVFGDERIDFADGRPGVSLPARRLRDLDPEPLDLIREFRRAD